MSNSDVTVFHEGPIINRRKAAQDGVKYYFTGKPCSRNHIALRFTSGFQCVVCSSLIATKWRTENPELAILKGRKYRERNPEKAALASRKWRDANPERIRQTSKAWWKTNPILKAEYMAAQKSRELAAREKRLGRKKPVNCECCGDLEADNNHGTRIHFDHCHVTNRARGWICHNCNLAIGHARDSPDRLRQMAEYLERVK